MSTATRSRATRCSPRCPTLVADDDRRAVPRRPPLVLPRRAVTGSPNVRGGPDFQRRLLRRGPCSTSTSACTAECATRLPAGTWRSRSTTSHACSGAFADRRGERREYEAQRPGHGRRRRRPDERHAVRPGALRHASAGADAAPRTSRDAARRPRRADRRRRGRRRVPPSCGRRDRPPPARSTPSRPRATGHGSASPRPTCGPIPATTRCSSSRSRTRARADPARRRPGRAGAHRRPACSIADPAPASELDADAAAVRHPGRASTRLVEALVRVPARPGVYTVEVDLLNERGRWFGAPRSFDLARRRRDGAAMRPERRLPTRPTACVARLLS